MTKRYKIGFLPANVHLEYVTVAAADKPMARIQASAQRIKLGKPYEALFAALDNEPEKHQHHD